MDYIPQDDTDQNYKSHLAKFYFQFTVHRIITRNTARGPKQKNATGCRPSRFDVGLLGPNRRLCWNCNYFPEVSPVTYPKEMKDDDT